MRVTLNKIAALLAFAIGAMSIFSGWRVIQGWNPGYSVVSWLPVYNFAMGIFTVLIPSVLIWREHRSAFPVAIATFSLHAMVLLALVVFFGGIVASESIAAMLFRLAIWFIVLALIFFARRKNS